MSSIQIHAVDQTKSTTVHSAYIIVLNDYQNAAPSQQNQTIHGCSVFTYVTFNNHMTQAIM